MNEKRALSILQELARVGVKEVCVCPGRRNSPFVGLLANQNYFKCWWWYEERSAAFFALGRSRALDRPVAVITTSGTAAGELLPAMMEAYYSGTPLISITADRPRIMRGTGAPQTADQKDLFGVYAPFSLDLEEEECRLHGWNRKVPAHLNICLDEPLTAESLPFPSFEVEDSPRQPIPEMAHHKLSRFFDRVDHPLVLVSGLRKEDRYSVLQFLLQLQAPVYLEAISGLREEASLQPLRISTVRLSEADGILRIGGVPTTRAWRDLETHEDVPVLSISPLPFSGLSRGELIHASLQDFFSEAAVRQYDGKEEWVMEDRAKEKAIFDLLEIFPESEPSLIHSLSRKIPEDSLVYLGNSMPIREWDLAASYEDRNLQITASRGLNGIDGQISTFLGMADPMKENWAILGDLTALYDLAAPWILKQMREYKIKIAIINNGGGQIFSRFYSQKEFLNSHNISFEGLAKFWEMNDQLIELKPNDDQTCQFWEAHKNLLAATL